MVDLHCHLLPGIDDGPDDIEQSALMCRLAAADGCEAMVTTPHQLHPNWWNGDRGELAELRRRLQERVGPRPRLLAGAEIRVGFDFLAEVERLPGGSLEPIAGSRYLLIELDRRGMGPDPAAVIHEMTVAGWRPIVAHPELYPWLMEDVELVYHLVGLGALLQVTAMSVTGEFGKRAEESCHRLLEEELVHFVASDCHSCDYRPPGLRRAYAVIAARWGERTARALTSGNPGAVIANRPLPSPAFA